MAARLLKMGPVQTPRTMSSKKSPEQRRREQLRALILFVLATALFVFAVINFIRIEG